jgi:SAM-dependent methyltransferase
LDEVWGPKIASIRSLVGSGFGGLTDWKVLETSSRDGIFTGFAACRNVVLSEFLEKSDRKSRPLEVRSEDLQCLSFDAHSLDAVIALEVFEHIPDPWKAFAEVKRVLKSDGIAVITVPIDLRNRSTATLARMNGSTLEYLRAPAYHEDPLRTEGALVFTEFGTDIIDLLSTSGYNARIIKFETKTGSVVQPVIILRGQ